MSRAPAQWSRSAWLAIGNALLIDAREELTAPEIGDLLGGQHPSNVKRTLDRMEAAGLVEAREPVVRPGAGRRATRAYALADDAKAGLREALEAAEPPGELRARTHIVYAQATDGVGELFHVLSQATPLARASWFALLDGSPAEYAIAFTGDDAVQGAVDLMAILDGASVASRRAAVAEVGTIETLSKQARRRAQAARRAGLARRTRQAS